MKPSNKLIIFASLYALAVLVFIPVDMRIGHVGLAHGPAVIDELSSKLGPTSTWGYETNNISAVVGQNDIMLLHAYKDGVESIESIYRRRTVFLKIALILVPLMCVLFGYKKGIKQAEYL